MINFSRSNTGLLAKWWRILDKQIFFCIIILLFFGLLVSFSSTSLMVSERLDQQSYYFFIKHLIFVLFSVFILFFISIQDIKIIKRFLTPTFLFLLFLFPIKSFPYPLFFLLKEKMMLERTNAKGLRSWRSRHRQNSKKSIGKQLFATLQKLLPRTL